MTTDFDVIVIGSGPNGLAAAINLQIKGLSVLLIESKSTLGGGLRTAELTLPGFKHDICSQKRMVWQQDRQLCHVEVFGEPN